MILRHDWLLTPARVAIHTPTRTAVLADLHLGYAEARHRTGEAVPLRAERRFAMTEPAEPPPTIM